MFDKNSIKNMKEMKPSLTTKVLIWICNFVLAVCLAAVFYTLYLAVFGFSLFDKKINELEGYSRATNMSQSMFGNTYFYQSVYDDESDSYKEQYYIAPGNMVYRFSQDEAPKVQARTLQEDLSKRNWFGFRTVRVYTDATEVPLILATPGFEVEDRSELNRLFRLGYLSYAGYALYLILLFWFVRKFLTGLKTNIFFTSGNSFNLKAAGFIVLAAPFLHYLWYKIIESVPITMLRIEGASLSSTVGYAFKFELLIAGLVLVVIGKAFDYGVKLQNEQELTI